MRVDDGLITSDHCCEGEPAQEEAYTEDVLIPLGSVLTCARRLNDSNESA